jgi:hypothetical protein
MSTIVTVTKSAIDAAKTAKGLATTITGTSLHPGYPFSIKNNKDVANAKQLQEIIEVVLRYNIGLYVEHFKLKAKKLDYYGLKNMSNSLYASDDGGIHASLSDYYAEYNPLRRLSNSTIKKIYQLALSNIHLYNKPCNNGSDGIKVQYRDTVGKIHRRGKLCYNGGNENEEDLKSNNIDTTKHMTNVADHPKLESNNIDITKNMTNVADHPKLEGRYVEVGREVDDYFDARSKTKKDYETSKDETHPEISLLAYNIQIMKQYLQFKNDGHEIDSSFVKAELTKLENYRWQLAIIYNLLPNDTSGFKDDILTIWTIYNGDIDYNTGELKFGVYFGIIPLVKKVLAQLQTTTGGKRRKTNRYRRNKSKSKTRKSKSKSKTRSRK